MLIGVGITFLIGIVWMFVGIVYSNATKDKTEFNLFMISCGVIYAIIAVGVPYLISLGSGQELIPLKYMPVKPLSQVPLKEFIRLACIMSACSLFSNAGFFLLAIAMRRGSHSVAWGIMQSAIIMPFLTGLLIFKDNVNWINLLGMLFIVVALFFMVRGKQINTPAQAPAQNKNKEFLIFLFFAFCCTGISQICALLPNKITVLFPDTAPFSAEVLAWRVPIVSLSGLLIWIIFGICTKTKLSFNQVKNALIYAIVVFAGQVLLYLAIDLLSSYKLSGIVYPLAMGCCIVLFSLFCMFYKHEKLHVLEKIGLGILTIGLFVQALASIC
jgi:drug/metabolite transporter (DMT)-like permease